MNTPSRRTLMLAFVVLALTAALTGFPAAAFADGPTLSVALTDYEPGDTVAFTGGGFQAGETVNLTALGSTNGTRINARVTADVDGNLSGSFSLPLVFEFVYSVTATGSGSGSASTTFYDSPQNLDFVSPVVTLYVNQSLSYTVKATTSGGAAIAGVPIGWFLPQGGGAWSVACNSTDANGIASSTFTAGPTAGNVQLQVKGFGESTCKTAVQGAVANLNVAITIPADTTPPVISYALTPATPDGANGWYKSNVTLVWTVTDPESAVTKTGCVDQNITTDQVAMNYSCSATSAGGTAGPVTVTIKRDATPPTNVAGSAARAPDHNGWYTSPVGVTFSGQDATSGIATCTSTTYSGPDSANTSVAGSCTDNAGNSTNGSFALKYDATAPTLTLTFTPNAPDGTNGWWKAASGVPFAWTCSDATSGIDASFGGGCPSPLSGTVTAQGTTHFSDQVRDMAGNLSVAVNRDLKLDNVGPTGVSVSADRGPDSNGWYNHAFTATWNGTDATSGVASCTKTTYGGPDVNPGSLSGTCTDLAGNTSGAIAFAFKYDATKPTITINGAADGSVCAKATPSFSATDNLSGVASSNGVLTPPSNPSGVGIYKYEVTATDVAGNSATASKSYTLTYGGAFGGYLPPVNPDGTSRFKLGSTIPVKFQLMCGTTPIANATAELYMAKGDTIPDPGVDEAISTAASTTGNLFRYDSTAQQYIFNLSTKLGYTNPDGTTITMFETGTWTLKIKLDDGTWRSVNVQLPK